MFLVVAGLILCLSLPSFASLNQFIGKWKNLNAHTRGLTVLKIRNAGNHVNVHAYGKCHPADCDWGTVRGAAYAPNVSANIVHSANRLSAIFNTGHSQIFLIIRPASNNRIITDVFTKFKDGSGRSNYWNTYTLRRVQGSGPGGPMHPAQPMQPMQPVQPIQPVQPSHPVHPAGGEDCISFNPDSAQVRNVGGRWKIVDGSHWMFDFGSKRNEALRALKIIKHYRMNQSCFVGRPNPSFQYMLCSGRAPHGGTPGEDCIEFNPNNIQVRNVNGSWKIVDGSHWMFDFGHKEQEARKAFRIIKKYRFRFSCFVGRPNPSFTYLKR